MAPPPYLAACFEAALDAMVIADDRGQYVEANHAACDLFGVSRDALIGRCISDFMPEDYNFEQAWRAFRATGTERGELCIVRADGQVREVEYSATADIAPNRHLCILRDITERKHLERQARRLNQAQEQQVAQRIAELHHTNSALQAALDARARAEIALECAGDGVWDWDAKTNEVYFSPQWKTMLGYAEHEIGNTLWEWDSRIHPDDREQVHRVLNRHLRGETPIYQSEHRVLAKDGTWKWVLDRGKVVARGDDGRPLRVIGTHVDITDRRYLEDTLHASQQKYQTLFEILPIGVSITDAEGYLVEANPASETILGISRIEQTQYAFAAPIWQMVYPDGGTMQPENFPAARALRSQHPITDAELGFRRSDGTMCWLSVSAAPLPLKNYGVAIAYLDITDRHNAKLRSQQQAQQETTFNEVVRAIRCSLDLEQIFEVSTQQIARFLKGAVSIFQYLPERQVWRQRGTDNCDDNYDVPANLEIPHSANPFAEQVMQGQVVQIDDTTTVRDPLNQAFAAVFPGAWLMVPITVDGVVWGNLSLARRQQANAWHPDEVTLTQRIADQLAIAIHQSNLYRELQDAHLRNELVLFSIGEGIWDWNPMIDRAYLSDRYWEILGYASAPYPSTQLACELERVHPDDREPWQIAIQAHLQTGRRFDLEMRVRHQRGHYIWVRSRGQAVWQDDGTPIRMVGTIDDIDARKRSEGALRQREQEIRALAENSPDAIMRCDRDGRFLYVNPTTAAWCDMTPPELIGKQVSDLGFPPHLINLWEQTAQQVFDTGQEQSLEYDITLTTGVRYVFARVVPEWDTDGRVASVLIVARDITNLKHSQTALMLRAARERLLSALTHHIRQSLDLKQMLKTAVDEVRPLLEADRATIYQVQPKGEARMVAESVLPPWPSAAGHVLSARCLADGDLLRCLPVRDCTTPSLPPDFRALLAQLQVRASLFVPIVGQSHLWGILCVQHCHQAHDWQEWEQEFVQRLADQLAIAIHQSELHQQIQRWANTLEQQVQARTAEIQQSLDFEATLKRITDRVRDSLDEDQILETAVQALGQVLQVECCDTGIYNADKTVSTITHEYTHSLNPAKGQAIGFDNASCAGIYQQLLKGDPTQFCLLPTYSVRYVDGMFATLACPIIDDQTTIGDLWLFREAGQWFVEAEVRLVKQVANQCAIALRQARLFKASQAQITQLERLNQLKDDFLSSVSHELRTPMASVKMATELLEIHLHQLNLLPDSTQENPDTSDPIIRYFQILKHEGNREISLIDDLLDLTRLEAKTEPLNLIPLRLQDWIPYLLEPILARTQKMQQHLIWDLPDTLPQIITDPSYLQRVIDELLNNASKYTPPGEQIRVEAWVQQADWIDLRFTNTGVEIPAEECDRIFDRFYRIPNNDPWKHGGTGLGLALVRKMVEYLGGSIQACSAPEMTQFTIQLPIQLET